MTRTPFWKPNSYSRARREIRREQHPVGRGLRNRRRMPARVRPARRTRSSGPRRRSASGSAGANWLSLRRPNARPTGRGAALRPPHPGSRRRRRTPPIRAPQSRAGACVSVSFRHHSAARRRRRSAGREQLLPGGTEDLVGADALDQPLVQLCHQPIPFRLVDDEREVQIVGRLAHEIDVLVLEQLERRPELGKMPRILCPSRLNEAHGPRTSTRHNLAQGRGQSLDTPIDPSVLAVGSKETVTFVSEVEIKSTDKPCCLKTWNASARNPT